MAGILGRFFLCVAQRDYDLYALFDWAVSASKSTFWVFKSMFPNDCGGQDAGRFVVGQKRFGKW